MHPQRSRSTQPWWRALVGRRRDPVWPRGIDGIATQAVHAAGMRWRVCTAGSPDAPPLLLLHGWGANAYMYRAMILPLAAAGYYVVVPDLPGHGYGDVGLDPARARISGYVGALRTLCDALGIRRTAIVGQSMGGAVALQLALDDPSRVAALALISPVGYTVPRAVRMGQTVVPHVLRPLFPWLARRFAFALGLRISYGRLGVPTAADVDEYFAPSRDPAFARALHTLLHEFEWNACDDGRARALRVPAVVICGDADRLVDRRTPEYFARDVPHARVHRVRGGGHTLAEEVPSLVTDAIVSVLRDVY